MGEGISYCFSVTRNEGCWVVSLHSEGMCLYLAADLLLFLVVPGQREDQALRWLQEPNAPQFPPHFCLARLLSLRLSLEILLLTSRVTGSSAPLSLDNVSTFLKKEHLEECILYHKDSWAFSFWVKDAIKKCWFFWSIYAIFSIPSYIKLW